MKALTIQISIPGQSLKEVRANMRRIAASLRGRGALEDLIAWQIESRQDDLRSRRLRRAA